MNTAVQEIKAAYEHTKAGTLLFNLCAIATEFLVKHKKLYYILACTWGFIMTFIGFVASCTLYLVKLIAKNKLNITFKPYNFIYSVSVGPDYCGGCNLGLCFLRDHKSTDSVATHEFGHTFQNCLLGPLFPFLVAIPSATRWWVRKLSKSKKFVPYDSVWFEDAATQCGQYAVKVLCSEE